MNNKNNNLFYLIIFALIFLVSSVDRVLAASYTSGVILKNNEKYNSSNLSYVPPGYNGYTRRIYRNWLFYITNSSKKSYQVYCLEENKDSVSGVIYKDDDQKLTNAKKTLISEAISVGTRYSGAITPSKMSASDATLVLQEIIWEITRGERTSFDSYKPEKANCSSNPVSSFYCLIKDDNRTTNLYSEYKKVIRAAKYSFKQPTYFKGDTYDLAYDSSSKKFTKTFATSNDNYDAYKYFKLTSSSTDVKVSKSSNGKTFTISSTKPITSAVTITAQNNGASKTVWNEYKSTSTTSPQRFGFGTKTVSYTLKVKTPKYSISVSKYDSENTSKKINGVKFGVYKDSSCKTLVATNAYITTNSSGSATYSSLTLPGTYYVKEQNTPTGYKASSKCTAVNTGKTVSIANTPIKYQLKIYKRDSETNSLLSGAKFRIFLGGDGKCSGTNYADRTILDASAGVSYVSLPKTGTYCIKELSAPTGYELNTSELKVTVTSANTNNKYAEVTFKNTKTKYQLMIKKVDTQSKIGLEGAVFSIYTDNQCKTVLDSSKNDVIRTNSGGEAYYNKILSTGTYYIKETKAPVNHQKNNECLPITITDEHKVGNKDNKYASVGKNIENDEITKDYYQLKIEKIDKDTKQGLKDVRFKIMYENEPENTLELVDEITTDSNGSAVYRELESTGTYYLFETSVPKGYIKLDSPVKIVVSDINKVKQSGNEYATAGYKVENQKSRYQLKISKEDSLTNKPMPGVSFDIYGSDCKTKIIRIETKENGIATYDQLSNTGLYCVKEVTPDGYESNSNEIKIKVTDENVSGSDSFASFESVIKNTPKIFNLLKQTVDSDGKTVDLQDECGTNDYTAEFQVRNSDKKLIKFKSSVNGTYNANLNSDGDLTGTIKTCNGRFSIYTLPDGKYYVTETKAPKGVQLNSKEIEIDTSKNKSIVLTNGFVGLEFQKKDEDGNLIPGGIFGLQVKENNLYKNVFLKEKASGSYAYSNENDPSSVNEFLTNDTGIARISDLPVGEYRIIEKQAPIGYELIKDKDSSSIVVINDQNKEDYTIVEMVNHKISKNGSSNSAELIITITTGRKILNYTFIILSLVVILAIALYFRKKFKK